MRTEFIYKKNRRRNCLSKRSKNFGLLGLDPYFKPNRNNKACAEMEEDEKNKISHRGKSSKAFVNWLKKKQNIFE